MLPIYYYFLIRLSGVCFVSMVVLLEVSRGVVLSFYVLFVELVVEFNG